jgi:hypothetical protein
MGRGITGQHRGGLLLGPQAVQQPGHAVQSSKETCAARSASGGLQRCSKAGTDLEAIPARIETRPRPKGRREAPAKLGWPALFSAFS